MTVEAYPLHWPEGWPRAKKVEYARFRVTPDQARRGMLDEIRLLIGRKYKRENIIISSNIRLRQDGEPYASQRPPEDKGVAVYFEYKGKSMVFACDRWSTIHDNMHAIAKSIAALRGIERWGASDMLERAFTGFQALPEKAGGSQDQAWYMVLGVDPEWPWEQIEEVYRSAVKRAHPDAETGSNEKFIRVRRAYEEAKQDFGRS